MKGRWQRVIKLAELLKPPRVERSERLLRLKSVERDVVLPVKWFFIALLAYNFYLTPWFSGPVIQGELPQYVVIRFFEIYLVVNAVATVLLILPNRLTLVAVQQMIFAVSFIDGLFLAGLTLVTGGFDSILYWALLGLIFRNAISHPLVAPQLILNFSVSFSYLLAGLLDVVVDEELALLEEPTRRAFEGGLAEPAAEPFLLRLIVLIFMTICCYGVQVLFDRGRQAAEEAREFNARQEQLRAAGRLAASIAHQLKNPLGIINNAAFSLQRCVREGRPPSPQQISIIREEVEKSDLILTELMGYAQLAEGQVEKLHVVTELNRAISEVFPPGAHYTIQVQTDYGADLPPLLMQRRHLAEIFVNILQNAREAMHQGGLIHISAASADETAVTIIIRDDGPGIPIEEQARIWQPYFTTKEKGTGLGLAIVRHNAEMYGASVRVESDPGHGTEFILHFPTRTFMKLRQ